ncbi:DUF3060 domain-containing protein [Mycobacteroides sp. LB1]|uniref:DUF3060 domain-containing protein n=1 Tax=Mycobacteroides sp. LB1 TaxID=2750814 RepID=UPI0015DE8C1B|nr:DUF3060 domain-containing protein [Mycobacteroides sp. LB1]
MEPDGDPEARIRELERSLSEAARTSELGVTNRSPYPPPVYQTTYAPRPPVRKFGRWFAVFSALIAAGAAGLVFYAANPTVPRNVQTSPGATTTRPVRSTVVKLPTRATATTTSVPGPTYAPPGSTFSVSGTHKQITVNCDDCSVNVSGVSNTVEVQGNCDTLTVSGVENAVTVETAREIRASGFDNKVTYHSGEPEVSKSGDRNTVEQG